MQSGQGCFVTFKLFLLFEGLNNTFYMKPVQEIDTVAIDTIYCISNPDWLTLHAFCTSCLCQIIAWAEQ